MRERVLRRDASKSAPAESWAFSEAGIQTTMHVGTSWVQLPKICSEDLDQPLAGPERFYYDRTTYTGVGLGFFSA